MSMFPTRQVIAAAGATLSTEQLASVYSSPSCHLETEWWVMLGGAVWGKTRQKFLPGSKMKIYSALTLSWQKYLHSVNE